MPKCPIFGLLVCALDYFPPKCARWRSRVLIFSPGFTDKVQDEGSPIVWVGIRPRMYFEITKFYTCWSSCLAHWDCRTLSHCTLRPRTVHFNSQDRSLSWCPARLKRINFCRCQRDSDYGSNTILWTVHFLVQKYESGESPEIHTPIAYRKFIPLLR